MNQEMVKVTIDGKEHEYAIGTTYREIVDEYQEEVAEAPVILVMADGKLRELQKKLKGDCTLEFVTTKDHIGFETYKRTVCLVLLRAIYDVAGKENIEKVMIHYSVGNGYYFTMAGKAVLDQHFLDNVKTRMQELADMCTPIGKRSVNTDDAVSLFHHHRMYDKEKLFRYRRSSRVNIYELDHYKDYFYGFMVPSTGYLRYYDVTAYQDGFVLLFPGKEAKKVSEFVPSDKLFFTLKRSRDWGKLQQIDTIGALNDAIAAGKTQEMVLTQEALFEERIGALAEMIVKEEGKKFIMIAGPSSSGKTTFSHRLSIQLAAKGLKPHPFPLDDYYVDRDKCPRDENGELDFECLESLDVELFNHDMNELLAGKAVNLPIFNFKTGKREYKDKIMQLGKDDVLVIEGIHGLNDKLSYSLPVESKFKIYISALTQLNIDEHNYLPTTDGRMIRRIVRDARTRGTSAKETIAMWDSVRRGEEKNIFPFQEGADVMFNSALIYELAVLKIYAEPLLFAIDKDCPEYLEAKRLLKFLDYFLPMSPDGIGQNSIIREFIGGSCFNV